MTTKKAQLLICDDAPAMRESLQLILERDYALAFTTNGEEAVAYAQKNPVDLVILDIKMPRLNGIETLKTLRRMKPGIQVLVMTGYESSDVAAQAVKLGAADYLVKPFERKKAIEQVEGILKKSGKIKESA